MNDPVLANTEVNVLQAVNLTLATSAILALADTLPDLFGDVMTPGWTGKALFALLILGWTLKLLVENHRSFATARVKQQATWAIFQLFMTVFMFLPLVVTAGKADDLAVSSEWLMISLIVGLVWLAALAGRYIVKGEFDAKIYNWEWVVSAVATVAGAAVINFIPLSFEDGLAWFLIAVMLATLIIDALLSKTFGKIAA